MFKSAIAAAALLACAGAAHAQTVEFRIVERDGQTAVTSAADAELNFAVQARVTGGPPGSALSSAVFDIVIPGEPDSNGTLAKLRIMSAMGDGTYYTGAPTPNATVGSGGLALPFTYLAGINAAFNGVINVSSGTYTNQPGRQEIALITGVVIGPPLLLTPNIDPNGEGNPATWSGYGSGNAPPNGSTATIDPAIAAGSFAQGQFIDIYRFRYTTNNFTTRTLNITLENATASTFTRFIFNDGLWGALGTNVPPGSVSVTAASISVATTDPGACCDASSGCAVTMGTACSGSFILAGTCTPDPCPPAGSCCATGNCTVTFQLGCTAVWTSGDTCSPNLCAQPGACCSPTDVCTLVLQTACTGLSWTPGACTVNICGEPGACCGIDCQLLTLHNCTMGRTWMQGTCTPSPCPPPSACCNPTNGACSLAVAPSDVVYTFVHTFSPSSLIFENHTGGTVQYIEASFSATTKRLTFDVALTGATTGGPLITTGFWLVISNGPDPKAHPGELAIFYFDATNFAAPLLTVYAYNGADAGTSFSDGDPATPGDQPGDLIKGVLETSYINQLLAEDTLVGNQPRRHFKIDIDATDILTHVPLYPAASPWFGTGFDRLFGVWFHPAAGFTPTYESTQPGRITSLDLTGHGWFDAPNRLAAGNDPCSPGFLILPSSSTCTPNPCPQLRACCDLTNALCMVVGPRSDCPANFVFASPAASSCSPTPCPSLARQASGSCCNTLTGGCWVMPLSCCDVETHTWLAAQSCTTGPCPPPTGACCNVVTGSCVQLAQQYCGPAAHDWTAGGTCSPNTCAVPGVCCTISSGACRRVTQSRCAVGGTWAPSGVCTPNPCALPGACCNILTGVCHVTSRAVCPAAAHDWMPTSACSPNPCAAPGICCITATGACRRSTQLRCAEGVWTPIGVCASSPCSRPGPCCDVATAVCDMRLRSACPQATHEWAMGSACGPSACAFPSACCNPATGACRSLTQARCTPGNIWVPQAACSPDPCSLPQGACCNVVVGTCSVSSQSACGQAAHDWYGGAACSPESCAAPAACCTTSGLCRRLTQTRCLVEQGVWLDGETCIAAPCSVAARATCRADFDQSGQADVADVFGYFSAWLALDPRADFNASDHIDAADIFDFLSAWLSGC